MFSRKHLFFLQLHSDCCQIVEWNTWSRFFVAIFFFFFPGWQRNGNYLNVIIFLFVYLFIKTRELFFFFYFGFGAFRMEFRSFFKKNSSIRNSGNVFGKERWHLLNQECIKSLLVVVLAYFSDLMVVSQYFSKISVKLSIWIRTLLYLKAIRPTYVSESVACKVFFRNNGCLISTFIIQMSFFASRILILCLT